MNDDFCFSYYIGSDWWFDDLPRMYSSDFPVELKQLSLEILTVKTAHADKKNILQKASTEDADEFIHKSIKKIISQIVKDEFFERVAYCQTIHSRISNFEDLLFDIILSALDNLYDGYDSKSYEFIKEQSDTDKAFDFANRHKAWHLIDIFQEIILYTILRLPYDIIHSSFEHVEYYLEYRDIYEEGIDEGYEDPSFILGKKLEEKIPVAFPKRWLDYGDNLVGGQIEGFLDSVYTNFLESDYYEPSLKDKYPKCFH